MCVCIGTGALLRVHFTHPPLLLVQEFFSYGVVNLVASFFSCFSSSGSLSRTTVADNTGAKTQVREALEGSSSRTHSEYILCTIAPCLCCVPAAVRSPTLCIPLLHVCVFYLHTQHSIPPPSISPPLPLPFCSPSCPLPSPSPPLHPPLPSPPLPFPPQVVSLLSSAIVLLTLLALGFLLKDLPLVRVLWISLLTNNEYCYVPCLYVCPSVCAGCYCAGGIVDSF